MQLWSGQQFERATAPFCSDLFMLWQRGKCKHLCGTFDDVNQSEICRAYIVSAIEKGKQMQNHTIVTLKKGEGRTIKAGGMWIFDNEIDTITGSFHNGDVVTVHDFDGYPMGKGFINQNSKIRIRMMTRRADQEIDTEFLRNRLKFSMDEITLAAQNSNIKDLTSWNLGSIVLSTVDLHYQKTFEIDTRGQFNNLSGITTVQVALDTEGLASKTIRVTDIPVVNAPSSYKYSVVTRSLSITVIGPEEDIKDLTEKDLLVTADLTGYSVKDASFEHEVTVTAPDYSKVWASGSYTVWIDAERNNEE